MTISNVTVEHLGIKLYDKVSAALAELVANAYDADATRVTITLPLGRYLARKTDGRVEDLGLEIRIEDNGSGMTATEVNDHYLMVGLGRRDRGEETPKGRRVMGRKGIGKLAPFGICGEIEVISAGGPPNARGPYEVANLILRLEDMLRHKNKPYNPQTGPQDSQRATQRGTTIILRNFRYKQVPSEEEFHRQMASRFGIRRGDWEIVVVDSKNHGKRFTIGELDVPIIQETRFDVSARPVRMGGTNLPVSGWVAYARDPYKDETMAGVRIYARGKLVAKTRDFDIKSGFTGEFKLRSYLVGEVNADWLDAEEDLIQSHRQDILWSSDKGEALRQWGEELIREIARGAETSISNTTWTEFLERSNLQERLIRAFPADTEFRKSVERAARVLVRQADRETIKKDDDYVTALANLAFSIAPHASLLEVLGKAADEGSSTIDTIIELFGKARVAEMYSLGQIADERVRIILRLEALIKAEAEDEPKFQRLLEEAPWLLKPAWTPLTKNRTLDRVREALQDWYKRQRGVELVTSVIDNPTKRPDFVLLSVEDDLEVVEIKRPGHALTDEEFGRAFGYLNALREFASAHPELTATFDDRLRLTIVCDEYALDSMNADHLQRMVVAREAKKMTWHTVLAQSKNAHADFLDAVRKMQGFPDRTPSTTVTRA